jgi:HupE / UreJ protein
MRIADLGAVSSCLVACLLCVAPPSAAHPVAQGAIQLLVLSDRLELRATVSNEEVLVQGAYADPPDVSATEAARWHGEYLRAHFRIMADGRLLDGRIRQTPQAAAARPTYVLDYPWAGDPPARIALQQDVLREFEFTPGNPWEASYLVRLLPVGQAPDMGVLLTHRQPLEIECRWQLGAAACFSERRARIGVAGTFLRHGIAHILAGHDHLLFLAALLLAISRLWDLIKVIGTFTLAHTITLVLAVLGVLRLPTGIVEPVIALSIVFVATQNIFCPEQSRGGSRLAAAFGFGLFHGLGFAGGLLDAMAGMQARAAALAIASFGAGVEIGHQLIVLPGFIALYWLRRTGVEQSDRDVMLRRYGSAAVSVIGMFYLLVALR